MSGFALDCEVYTSGFNKPVFVVFAENGERVEYNGPDHPDSTTTIYGVWTGVAPYANALPAKVRGRYQLQTSALDSYSMLYYIQCYQQGFHNSQLDQEYVNRIKAALDVGTIRAQRDLNEFKAALRILRSFETSGHVFQSIVAEDASMEYDLSVGSLPRSMLEKLFTDASTSYPLFELSEPELEQYQSFVSMNSDLRPPSSIEELVEYMEEADLRSTVEYVWLSKRMYEYKQAAMSAQRLISQLYPYHTGSSSTFPMIGGSERRRTHVPKESVQEEAIIQSITSKIISSLL
jgi:hypothetical protein